MTRLSTAALRFPVARDLLVFEDALWFSQRMSDIEDMRALQTRRRRRAIRKWSRISLLLILLFGGYVALIMSGPRAAELLVTRFYPVLLAFGGTLALLRFLTMAGANAGLWKLWRPRPFVQVASQSTGFTPFELVALERVRRDNPAAAHIISRQLMGASIGVRHNSGSGAVTTVVCPPHAPRLEHSLTSDSPMFWVSGFELPVGVKIWTTDGLVDAFEMFTFSEMSRWTDWSAVTFEDCDHPRIDELARPPVMHPLRVMNLPEPTAPPAASETSPATPPTAPRR